jgi:hypothetical protein
VPRIRRRATEPGVVIVACHPERQLLTLNMRIIVTSGL